VIGGTTGAGGTARPYRRRSARVLLVDEADRLLLFRSWTVRGRWQRRVPWPRRGPRRAWFTPGGGVEDGLQDLIAGRRPPTQVELPWHH
jgi:8-oxo-dGTP pyrophosphatase MutT (NUDIX family)